MATPAELWHLQKGFHSVYAATFEDFCIWHMLLPFDVWYCPQAAHVELIQLFNVTTVNGPHFTDRSNSLQDTSTWSMPPSYLTWSQIILLARKVSLSLLMNFFSLLVHWKASFYSCLTVWKNKQHSDNVPQLAVHVFASHDLMHQDIHSEFDWDKIHKTVSFLVNHGSCILGVLVQNFTHFTFSYSVTPLTGTIQTSDVFCSCLCQI